MTKLLHIQLFSKSADANSSVPLAHASNLSDFGFLQRGSWVADRLERTSKLNNADPDLQQYPRVLELLLKDSFGVSSTLLLTFQTC